MSYSYTYNSPKSYLKYDDERFIVYLNEEIIPDWVPENYGFDPEYQPEPTTGYKYTGKLSDGGTLIACTAADRNSLINGIIRSRYSQTEEDAIKTHQIEALRDNVDAEKKAEYEAEWEAFNEFRVSVIATVDKWLA